jgi:hypothetical protein
MYGGDSSTVMSQQLQKPFTCFTCKQEIKLARKDDNSGWLKFNMDGTEHKHSTTSNSKTKTTTTTTSAGPTTTLTMLAALEKRISTLSESVTSLEYKIDQLKLEFMALKAVVLNDKRQ